MQGMELARRYYEAFGAPMLREQFPQVEKLIAVGLTGSGSECYGFDDAVSRDHDFEPGFCLFLPEEDLVDRRTEFLLERAYARLPDSFEGFGRQKLQPVGGARHGVHRLRTYYRERLGYAPDELTPLRWLALPEEALAEAVNGAVFRDDAGRWTAWRELLRSMPEDVRRKKLAGHLLMMAQSGQYNYLRCLRHGEQGAAQLAVGEYVRHAMAAAFLLRHETAPYYKWQFRALRRLEGMEDWARSLEWLLTTDNGEKLAREKAFCMEGMAAETGDMLREQGLSTAEGDDLEKHAYAVNEGIEDGEIRNLHILAAV